MVGLKILTLDLETRPNLGYIWQLFDQNVGLNQLVEVSSVICFAAKWHGNRAIEFRSDHHDGHEAMIRRAHELIDEADAVVGWNSKGFDVKHLRREFLLAGLPPASPHKDIDLLSTARRQFKFASNKLEHVARQLGVGCKTKHSGFDLWVGCMAGDEKAWKTMKAYNIQDVRLTEQLYDRLLPWIPNHPHLALYDDKVKGGCPRCGSMEYMQRGWRRSEVARYRLYQCKACRGYWTGTHRDNGVGARSV